MYIDISLLFHIYIYISLYEIRYTLYEIRYTKYIFKKYYIYIYILFSFIYFVFFTFIYTLSEDFIYSYTCRSLTRVGLDVHLLRNLCEHLYEDNTEAPCSSSAAASAPHRQRCS